MSTPGRNKGSFCRAYPVETLAFAYELRQEYSLCWKAIARIVGIDSKPLRCAVYHLLLKGIKQ